MINGFAVVGTRLVKIAVILDTLLRMQTDYWMYVSWIWCCWTCNTSVSVCGRSNLDCVVLIVCRTYSAGGSIKQNNKIRRNYSDHDKVVAV